MSAKPLTYPLLPEPYVIENMAPGCIWIKDAKGDLVAATRSMDFAREIAVLPILIAEAREIIRKVECGEMRSVKTYGAMKRAIDLVEGRV